MVASVKWVSEGNTLLAGIGTSPSWKILEAENPLSYLETYEAMSARFLNSEKVANLIALYRELDTLPRMVSDSLNEILIRRDYITHTCRLCPGHPEGEPKSPLQIVYCITYFYPS